jgi:hypothetical protein
VEFEWRFIFRPVEYLQKTTFKYKGTTMNKITSFILAVAFMLVSFSASGEGIPSDDMKGSAALGQRQLIQAIDAGWVRVLASGEYYDIINDPANAAIPQGILASENAVNQSDCLPDTEVTTFPSGNPAGNFKTILQKGEINRCIVTGATVPWDTTNFYRAGDALEEAVFDEIEVHYGVTINRNDVEIPPPFDLTTALNDGTCDYIQQVNALGGETEDLRRRNTRMSSCTISSSAQFLYVPNSGVDRACVGSGACASAAELAAIQDITDLRDDGLNICSGNLSTQLSNQYFPNSRVNTVRFPGDIGNCAVNVSGEGYCACPPPFIPFPGGCEYRPSDNSGGVCPTGIEHRYDDVMVFSITDIDDALVGPFGPFAGQYRQVDLKIVAGTPLWVGISPPKKK